MTAWNNSWNKWARHFSWNVSTAAAAQYVFERSATISHLLHNIYQPGADEQNLCRISQSKEISHYVVQYRLTDGVKKARPYMCAWGVQNIQKKLDCTCIIHVTLTHSFSIQSVCASRHLDGILISYTDTALAVISVWALTLLPGATNKDK